MNAQSHAIARRNWARASRPVIAVPGLSVVPSPLPSRGYFRTVAVCTGIFAGAIGGAFALNTVMIQGAYEIKSATVELNELQSGLEGLREDVARLETPAVLHERAQKFEMVPAEQIRYIDLTSGLVSGAAQAKK
ncbi:hypothetical protein [Arcanobacterium hippocoleae]|uniref:Cell division protein FtsL n=1 Tax=Arcanobacterium hippocoleae TaxID=149017 RepID=A0ABU1T0V6_9ACTO|nr:hypothetical protein [Arcanobacterium hippocoleae]MDR6939009.1 hypothetical protein [Arcanobacterium hippocoleae]